MKIQLLQSCQARQIRETGFYAALRPILAHTKIFTTSRWLHKKAKRKAVEPFNTDPHGMKCQGIWPPVIGTSMFAPFSTNNRSISRQPLPASPSCFPCKAVECHSPSISCTTSSRGRCDVNGCFKQPLGPLTLGSCGFWRGISTWSIRFVLHARSSSFADVWSEATKFKLTNCTFANAGKSMSFCNGTPSPRSLCLNLGCPVLPETV